MVDTVIILRFGHANGRQGKPWRPLSSFRLPCFAQRRIGRLLAGTGLLCVLCQGQTHGPAHSAAAADSTVVSEMHEAVASAQHGDEQHALDVIGQLLKQHPAFVPALKLQGMLLEDTGKDEDAVLAFEKALKLSPSDPDMLLKVGTLDLVGGHIEQAITLLGRRVHAVPGDEEGNFYLAQAYHLNGNNEFALATMYRALQAAPDDVQVWQKYGELLCSAGRNDDAIKWLKKAQEADPSLKRIDFDLAFASSKSMDLQAAEQYAADEAALQPNDLDDLALLAATQLKLGEWQAAKASTERVLAVRTDDPVSMLELGQCELELKNYQAAIEALNRSLHLDPTQVMAHFLLSRAYSSLGDTMAAQHEAALHREMMQHVSFAVPKLEANRALALSEEARELLAEGREAEALRLFEGTAPAPYATRGSAWVPVGATYLSMGETKAAERCLTHSLVLDPKTRGAHLYLGILALQSSDLGEAEKNFKAELALDPNHPPALAELGEVRYRQGRWAEAAELLTRSKTTTPALLYMLCDSEFQLGKIQAADLTAEALGAYGKGEPEIMEALTELLKRNGQADLAARLTPPA